MKKKNLKFNLITIILLMVIPFTFQACSDSDDSGNSTTDRTDIDNYIRSLNDIAQDEESSIVFGMPKEAIALGAAEEVLSLEQIGARLRLIAECGITIRNPKSEMGRGG